MKESFFKLHHSESNRTDVEVLLRTTLLPSAFGGKLSSPPHRTAWSVQMQKRKVLTGSSHHPVVLSCLSLSFPPHSVRLRLRVCSLGLRRTMCGGVPGWRCVRFMNDFRTVCVDLCLGVSLKRIIRLPGPHAPVFCLTVGSRSHSPSEGRSLPQSAQGATWVSDTLKSLGPFSKHWNACSLCFTVAARGDPSTSCAVNRTGQRSGGAWGSPEPRAWAELNRAR